MIPFLFDIISITTLQEPKAISSLKQIYTMIAHQY